MSEIPNPRRFRVALCSSPKPPVRKLLCLCDIFVLALCNLICFQQFLPPSPSQPEIRIPTEQLVAPSAQGAWTEWA